jgi:CRISPR-associated endonuclease/helicase Cas3
MLRYGYVYESWTDHVKRVMDQAKAMGPANLVGARKLDNSLALVAGKTENLVELSALLHDICKLTKQWQGEAWKYETARTGKPRNESIAHTTKKPGEQGPKFPPHAVEGAFAASEFLLQELQEAGWAVASSIARHHSARAGESMMFELIPGAEALVSELGGRRVSLRNSSSLLRIKELTDDLEAAWEDDCRKWWPLYAYLVRRLRLADQAGTAAGVREGGRAA